MIVFASEYITIYTLPELERIGIEMRISGFIFMRDESPSLNVLKTG